MANKEPDGLTGKWTDYRDVSLMCQTAYAGDMKPKNTENICNALHVLTVRH